MRKKKSKNREENGQRGAIIVEASIVLPIFMFAMFTFLSIITIAYTQARISVALTSATKQIAEYTNVLYATGLDETFSGTGGNSSELFDKVGEFLSGLGGELSDFGAGSLGETVNAAGSATSSTSIADLLKDVLSGQAAYQLMKKNLSNGDGDDADTFLKRHHVKMPSNSVTLSFANSSAMESGGRDIFLNMTYEVEVIKLLDIEYTFNMSAWAYTTAWSGQ